MDYPDGWTNDMNKGCFARHRGGAILRSGFSTLFFLLTSFSIAATASVPVAARPALVMEALTGKVIYAQEADRLWHPASVTKIMTAYLTFEAIKKGKLTLDTKITCSHLASREPPSKIGLPVGAKMTVRTALDALIIKSANDVAVMLAEAVGGTHNRFVARMNATAKRLGMTRTHYDNPNGLPSKGQVTTARDLGKLARAVLRDYPQYNHLWKKLEFRLGRRRIGGHNGLLRSFAGADGMKTGFICDSGYNVVASATRNGRKLVAVVMGSTSGAARTIRAKALLEHGFNVYGWKLFFNTTTVDNMPMSRSPDVASIRKQVRNAACGYYRPRRKRRISKSRRRKLSRAARLRASKARAAKRRALRAARKKKVGS